MTSIFPRLLLSRFGIFFTLLTTSIFGKTALFINEIVASNDTIIRDEDGDTPDWLELYSAGDSTISLAGFGLSDDPNAPYKWRFPAIGLAPQTCLLVFASDKNRADPLAPLHTNYKLSAGGETIVLTSPAGERLDSISFPPLPANQSFGRLPDGSGEFLLLSQATPGALNASTNVQPVMPAPRFSHAAGFYPATLQISLAVDFPNAVIYFTRDGSEPDTSSMRYVVPIVLDTTTVIRARAFALAAFGAATLPSREIISTFVIGETFSFPVVALSTDPYNLWDENYGIYARGPNASPNYPYKGANFWREWERPVHIEFFEDNQALVLAENAGMRIFGHYSVGAPFKPLALYARQSYGAGKFRYRFFPDKSFEEFEAIMLRNSGNDWNRTLFRDAFMHRLAAEIGLPTQAYRPVILLLNGQYWGIHNLRERLNEHYVAANFNVDADAIDLVAWNYGFKVYAGDSLNYAALCDFLLTADLSQPDQYELACQQIDIDNCIDYFCTEIFCNNKDWPGNNLYMWRPRAKGGRWMWLVKDMDHGFGLVYSYNYDTLARNAVKDKIFAALLENADFRDRFVTRFSVLMSTVFQPEYVKAIIAEMQAKLEPEMGRHLARWAGAEAYDNPPATLDEWRNYCKVLYDFADHRIPFVQQFLRNYFKLGDLIKVTVNVDAEKGRVFVDRRSLGQASWSGEFFAGLPLSLKAEPHAGYRFVGWSGADAATDSISIAPTADLTLTANFAPLNGSGFDVVINEINYNSATHFDPGDWVELANATEAQIDLSNWVLKDQEDKHSFVLPPGTRLPANGFLVISREKNRLRACFPRAHNVIGDLNFGLANDGDMVRLFDAGGRLVDVVAYKSVSPWPALANGRGATLALVTPQADNALPANWFASSPYGTPGSANLFLLPEKKTAPGVSSYPNPFNSSTVFSFHLDAAQFVSAEIFNLRGQLVATLANDILPAGPHTLQWRAENQPSGLYFCRTKIADQTTIRKITLQR